MIVGKDGSGSSLWDANLLPHRAFDGDPHTIFATGWEPNPWLLADLENAHYIVGAVLTNRIDCCQGEWNTTLTLHI